MHSLSQPKVAFTLGPLKWTGPECGYFYRSWSVFTLHICLRTRVRLRHKHHASRHELREFCLQISLGNTAEGSAMKKTKVKIL